MNIKKIIYVTIGCIAVMLGFIGAVLPLLPAFPFLLLAAICFAKSSTRLHTWFVHTKMYEEHIQSYVQGKGMSKKTKIRASIFLTISMGIGFVMMHKIIIGQCILFVVWLFHLLYFLFGVKTKENGLLRSITLYVNGLTSNQQAVQLEEKMNKQFSTQVQVDYQKQLIRIQSMEEISIDDIYHSIQQVGYQVLSCGK